MKGITFYKVVYYIGVSLSLLIGVWHFFVPLMFQWYSYIPSEYQNLIVGIDWTNLCFSLLLTGTSLLLLVWGKKLFEKNVQCLTLYAFLTFVWVFRVLIAIIEPWPVEPIAWAAYLQLAVSILIMLLLSIPCIRLIAQLITDRKNK